MCVHVYTEINSSSDHIITSEISKTLNSSLLKILKLSHCKTIVNLCRVYNIRICHEGVVNKKISS